ncbi:MAG: CoA pyrophosphatase [Thermoproteota archaeon]|nr:CoA pyrophosphatase [Thermoproteota archaeon]
MISNNESLKIPNELDFQYINPDKSCSSVLVIIHFPHQIPSVLLTKRSLHLKNHAGEISFPGGKFCSSDKSFLDTAIRETYEEIGIAVNKKQIIGRLSPTYTYTSKILIYPFIAMENKISDKLNPNSEVEQIINLPVEKLKTSLSEDEFHSNKNFKMFKFMVDDHIVWGATARILKDLLDKLIPHNPHQHH